MVWADHLSQFPSRKKNMPIELYQKHTQHILCTRQIKHGKRSCGVRSYTQHHIQVDHEGMA